MTIGDVAGILGIGISGDKEGLMVKHLLTDSRSLEDPEGTLFFAISTPTTDATRFMRTLYERGVRLFLAPETPADMDEMPDAVVLVYPDPVRALQIIAARRGGNGGEVVAITGSRGKTTLKEWLFQLTSGQLRVARSPRSYNSQIGVPLSMWGISKATELSLIEAGVSEPGEMARLAACIQPDTVIVTCVTGEHSEGFASKAEKIREKVGLASFPTVKRIIYCADERDVAEAVDAIPAEVERVSWSADDLPATVNITGIQRDHNQPGNVIISWRSGDRTGDIVVRSDSDADTNTACMALTFLISEGYTSGQMRDMFLGVHPISTRLSVADGRSGCNIIYDSYTSDYSSLPPAIDFLMRRKIPGQQSVVILSDFAHTGGEERGEYADLAALLRQRGVDRLIAVGPNLKENRRFFGAAASFFDTVADVTAYLKENPLKDACVLVKGAPEYDFSHLREMLEVRTHETILEVNLDAMIRNYNYFRSHVPSTTGMIAMVKASGYGAGSYEIAKTLQDAGASYLAVAVLDEGLDLRRKGITMPIMVMNPRVADYVEMFSNRLEPEIYTPAMLEDVIRQASAHGVRNYPIHIKLDTGMHRMGFIESELPDLMRRIAGQDNVIVSSVFSHLATADCPDLDDYTERQLATFERCSEYMMANCAYPFKRHILNSAGILRYPQYHYDMVRLGIGLYGVNTLPASMEKPLDVVSTLRTVIINLRDRKAGESIGYARRGMLTRDSRIATIPIGYADGMNRHFGNGAVSVLVNGREAPTVGNICMDACMIDVTGIDCRVGDTVEIFGRRLPLSRLSETLDTIPYEILTSVSPRVKRVYYRE